MPNLFLIMVVRVVGVHEVEFLSFLVSTEHSENTQLTERRANKLIFTINK